MATLRNFNTRTDTCQIAFAHLAPTDEITIVRKNSSKEHNIASVVETMRSCHFLVARPSGLHGTACAAKESTASTAMSHQPASQSDCQTLRKEEKQLVNMTYRQQTAIKIGQDSLVNSQRLDLVSFGDQVLGEVTHLLLKTCRAEPKPHPPNRDSTSTCT